MNAAIETPALTGRGGPSSPLRVGVGGVSLEPALQALTDPYQIKINDKILTEEPLELESRHEQCKVKIEMVRLSTTPIWNIGFRMKAEPSLRFWQHGKTKTLSDTPQDEFKYDYQIFMAPLANGKSIVVPVDISSIKEGSYTFHLTVKSKIDTYQKDLTVRFKKKF